MANARCPLCGWTLHRGSRVRSNGKTVCAACAPPPVARVPTHAKPEEVRWTDAKGDHVKIGSMDDARLINTLRWVEGKLGEDPDAEAWGGEDDGEDAWPVSDQPAVRLDAMVANLRAVAQKRGLLIDGRCPTPTEQLVRQSEKLLAPLDDVIGKKRDEVVERAKKPHPDRFDLIEID
jgi:hypothetical protein